VDAQSVATVADAAVAEWKWLAAATIAWALIYSVIRWLGSKRAHPFFGRVTRTHLLDGLAMFPMFLLVVSPFIPGLAFALIEHDSAILAAAGAVAILSIVEPDRAGRPPYAPPVSRAKSPPLTVKQR
jgi:hypothetical protein